MWFFGLNATFRAATLERQHYKVMLWAWFPNFIKFVVSSSFECNYFWNYSSFIRCGNCERFSFSWNLSAFASQCLNSRLRALHKFFGQEDHPSLKSEGAPATLVTVVENKTKQGDTKASCDKMETFLVTSLVWNFFEQYLLSTRMISYMMFYRMIGFFVLSSLFITISGFHLSCNQT